MIASVVSDVNFLGDVSGLSNASFAISLVFEVVADDWPSDLSSLILLLGLEVSNASIKT